MSINSGNTILKVLFNFSNASNVLRQHPIKRGFRPQMAVIGTDEEKMRTSVSFLLDGNELINIGEQKIINVVTLESGIYKESLKENALLNFYEGKRIIGNGKLIEIIGNWSTGKIP